MAIKQTNEVPLEFIKALSKGGLDDAHIIRRETAQSVLTPERERLLQEIAEHDVNSVRDLARRVDRNVSVVSRDLDVLFEADIIDFDQDGRSKQPRLAHDNVVVEPIVLDGEVRSKTE